MGDDGVTNQSTFGSDVFLATHFVLPSDFGVSREPDRNNNTTYLAWPFAFFVLDLRLQQRRFYDAPRGVLVSYGAWFGNSLVVSQRNRCSLPRVGNDTVQHPRFKHVRINFGAVLCSITNNMK